ncbi:MIF4G domain-containing protein [Cryptosporidium felis]|nr:MIF4G domain-containing protein [Cryptosporidium felis]
MTSGDNTGNSNTGSSQGNTENSSKFKSQLRADAQEFKPTFGISGANSTNNTGIYYHGTIPNYNMTDYDGYRISNPYYNKGHSKKQIIGEFSKVSTHLNPNAQEFIPRGWLNPNNELLANNNDAHQANMQSNIEFCSNQIDEIGSQYETACNSRQDLDKYNSDLTKTKVEVNLSPNPDREVCNNINLYPDDVKSHKKEVRLDSGLDLSSNKLDQITTGSIQSNRASPHDSSNHSTQFTFKDKLLARVCTPNISGNTANNLIDTNIENKSNPDVTKSSLFNKTTEIRSNSFGATCYNTEKLEENSVENEEKNQSNRHQNGKLNDMPNSPSEKKQVDSGPVSWAQRLKNSTSNSHSNKKTVESNSTNTELVLRSENQSYVTKKEEKQDIALTSISPSGLNDELENGFDDVKLVSTKGIDSVKLRKDSPIEPGISIKKDEDSNYKGENQKLISLGSRSRALQDSSKIDANSGVFKMQTSKFEYSNEEKIVPGHISIFDLKMIPIFVLLAVRGVSVNFKHLESNYSPPELCKRNLNSKELDRDGTHRGRGGWSGNLSHSSGGKHYNRDGGNYGPANRRERYQSHGNAPTSQGARRINDISNGGNQNSMLDWTRDERKMFRLESSAESWVVKQKEQKTKGNQFETQLRQYRAILNKLTIEKFDKLYDQILSVGINNEEEMIGLLKLVFDKATTQHHFIPMYVELCDKLRNHLKDVTTIETRRILVDLSQELFVENLSDMVLPEHVQDNEEDSFEWQLKYKNKMKGNMIFMASLVRKKVIASTVVLMCMEELLQFHLPHHLEALCVFLHHVGPFLDSERWKHYEDFNTLFHRFEEFSTNAEIPIRIRFLINDVIDSRRNNWKSKNTKEGPMMLDDLKSKINAERGETGSVSAKANNASCKPQCCSSYKAPEKNITTENVKYSGLTQNPWQRQNSSNVSKSLHSSTNNYVKISEKNSIHTSGIDASVYKSEASAKNDEEYLEDDSEHFLPEHIKNSIGGLMDSYVASYDLNEFFGHINDLEIPPEHFNGVYKNIFIRIAEYKMKQRNALFKALIFYSLKNKVYMNGESAKAGILMALQPSILNDILIDVPQFKEIVLTEFISNAISEYDSNKDVFDSEFISRANSLLS